MKLLPQEVGTAELIAELERRGYKAELVMCDSTYNFYGAVFRCSEKAGHQMNSWKHFTKLVAGHNAFLHWE